MLLLLSATTKISCSDVVHLCGDAGIADMYQVLTCIMHDAVICKIFTREKYISGNETA